MSCNLCGRKLSEVKEVVGLMITFTIRTTSECVVTKRPEIFIIIISLFSVYTKKSTVFIKAALTPRDKLRLTVLSQSTVFEGALSALL